MSNKNTSVILDATGLSCPEPLLKAHPYLIGNTEKKLTVYVDNEASKENILRAAKKHGWNGEAIEITSAMLADLDEKLQRAKFQLNLNKA